MKEMMFLAMMLDPYGPPRAWGSAPDRADAVDMARSQLRANIEDPVREFRRESDYTLRVERFKSVRPRQGRA